MEELKDPLYEKCGVTHDEVARHYGYNPEDFHRNSVGRGIWRKEEAFQMLNNIGEFTKIIDEKEKARIEFNYDPSYPVALIVTYVTLKV